jgi:hypothetical protein
LPGDAHDPSFWQGGFAGIERLIDELEALEAADSAKTGPKPSRSGKPA